MTAIHLISLGAGVQSSCMALMAAHGLIQPHPVAAIFADTQAEPASIYRWLDQLEAMIAQAPHPFPVHRVTRGDLAKAALDMRTTKDGRKFTKTDIPYFTLSAAGQQGQVPQRACTADYKIKPILRKARELGGIKRGQKAVQFEKAGTNMSSTPYLHRSCRPLGEIDFSTEEERGQGTLWQDNFTAECEGMCGV